MAFQHHSEGMSPELRKLFEKELDLRKRFVDQVEGRSKRSWSDGRAGATDDGDVVFAVGQHPDKELVVVDFGKPVEWVAMPPHQSIELAQSLIKFARAISKSPVVIDL